MGLVRFARRLPTMASGIVGEGRRELPVDGSGLPNQPPGTNLPRVVESVRDPPEVILPTAPEPTAAGFWGWGGELGAVAVRGDLARWLRDGRVSLGLGWERSSGSSRRTRNARTGRTLTPTSHPFPFGRGRKGSP